MKVPPYRFPEEDVLEHFENEGKFERFGVKTLISDVNLQVEEDEQFDTKDELQEEEERQQDEVNLQKVEYHLAHTNKDERPELHAKLLELQDLLKTLMGLKDASSPAKPKAKAKAQGKDKEKGEEKSQQKKKGKGQDKEKDKGKDKTQDKEKDKGKDKTKDKGKDKEKDKDKKDKKDKDKKPEDDEKKKPEGKTALMQESAAWAEEIATAGSEEEKEEEALQEGGEEVRDRQKAQKLKKLEKSGQLPQMVKDALEQAEKSASPRLAKTQLINRLFKKEGGQSSWFQMILPLSESKSPWTRNSEEKKIQATQLERGWGRDTLTETLGHMFETHFEITL